LLVMGLRCAFWIILSKLIKLLEDRPIHVVRVSERGSSSVDPFTKKRIDGYSPLVIRTAVRGLKVGSR